MKKVLIVEDDPHIARIYDIKFKKSQFETLTAADGEEALAMVIEKKPEVMLLDLMLPKLDGFGVLNQLKKKATLMKKMSIIVLSNLGQQVDIDRAKSLGAKEYLVKADHSIQEVVDTVMKYLK